MTPWHEDQGLRLEVGKDCRSVLALTSISVDLLWELLSPPYVLLPHLSQGNNFPAKVFLEAVNFS